MTDQQDAPIRVFLVDDHPLLVAGFTTSLSSQGIQVVGEASTPKDVVHNYRELNPDVVVLDIKFAGRTTGFEAAKDVLREFPHAKIVFLSQFDLDTLIIEAYKLGGYAFITKDSDPGELAAAIRKAHKGEQFFLPAIAERLAVLLTRGDPSPLAVLNRRELDVFALMAQGLTNAEIADRLGLSLKTISNESLAVKEKLRVSRAADVTRLAIKYGVMEP